MTKIDNARLFVAQFNLQKPLMASEGVIANTPGAHRPRIGDAAMSGSEIRAVDRAYQQNPSVLVILSAPTQPLLDKWSIEIDTIANNNGGQRRNKEWADSQLQDRFNRVGTYDF